MNDKLVNVQLHGVLAEQVGRDTWNIAVSSVGEALRAIESQSKKLFKNLIKNDKENVKYRVLINKKTTICRLTSGIIFFLSRCF